jgi:GTP-binding protein EngB required for normal cell division
MIMEINDTKISVLRQSVESMRNHIGALCDVRDETYTIKRAEWLESVEKIKSIIESDQILLFIGPFSSGKSTFVNALLGEALLPTARKPCTSVVTELRFVSGGRHRGKVVKFDETEEEMEYDDLIRQIDGPRGAVGAISQYHHIELNFDVTQLEDWEAHPLSQLKNMNVRIVDCPGYGSPYITNEDVIEEYIQKASFTFWMSPADKFGGAAAERRLSHIKKKTTALIPVITMSDKIDAAQREQVTDDFYDHLGHLFPKSEPRFVSAHRYDEAVKLAKELDKDSNAGESNKARKTKEEKERIREQIDILKGQSGLEQIFSDMVKSGQKKILTDSVLKSALHDLYKLFSEMNTQVKKEESYWQGLLKKQGWNPGDEYQKLNEIKRELDSWIKSESEHTADNLETTMTKKLIAYIMQAKGKVDSQHAQMIIADVWEKELNQKKNDWAEHLVRAYGDGFVNIGVSASQLTLPDLGSIIGEFTNVIKAVLESLRYAGPQTVLTGGLGAAICASTGAVGGIAIIGGALATVTAIIGPLLILVAVVPLFPTILDKIATRKEQYRKEMENKLKVWMKQLNLSPFIASILNEQNTKLYESCKLQFSSDLQLPVSNYERCGKIKEDLEEAYNKISTQFPNEFRGQLK